MILKLILLAIGGGLLLLAVRRLSKYRLKERYTLGFMILGLPFFALAMRPTILGYVAQQLQIDYHTLIILMVTAFFLLVFMEMLTIVSTQDRKIATLSQMVGILMAGQKFDMAQPHHDPAAQPSPAEPQGQEPGGNLAEQ